LTDSPNKASSSARNGAYRADSIPSREGGHKRCTTQGKGRQANIQIHSKLIMLVFASGQTGKLGVGTDFRNALMLSISCAA
jgi:hypothetical protein